MADRERKKKRITDGMKPIDWGNTFDALRAEVNRDLKTLRDALTRERPMTQEQDIVERLLNICENDDHERGCQGREYDCTCGFDERTFATAKEAAQTIAALRAEKAQAHKNWRNRAEAAEAKVKELEAMLRGADEILMEHQEIADTAIRERDEARKALDALRSKTDDQ